MYPFLRMGLEIRAAKRAAPLGTFDTHVSRLRCWPHDLDIFRELNNGRTLTLYDLGRVALFYRLGLVGKMRERRWVGTVAGSSVRYRKRVRLWDEIEMRSRLVGWDARFFYLEQGMWVGGTCTSHGLFRNALTDRNGLVPTATATEILGGTASPPLPGWITAWGEAEGERPWPPMQDEDGPR
ncbi:acyl-CoA thioesterase [Palleronia sp. LCG004]|uniref:acyl-CoA thioesterase n=1 Tax=Palleronia sp. LCG004 TaxID=3079304 RepID=UPI00294360AE|nr:acyl-CoA thioesterase [Palleronia sp. LCG004]WOI56135.1 acyl-CoA thioesterase [Palleronia sp. LCG004]